MSLELIKFAFVAGEVSKTFFGRSDLEKYDFGLETAINWFVDYRGGISTRPGSVFVDHIKNDNLDVKITQFKFAPNLANTYLVLFGHNYIRFVQDGGYVLEANKTITGITKASPGVITSTAHGFSTGDWVKFNVAGMTQLNGRSLVVVKINNDTFRLNDVDGNAINTTAFGTFTSGTVARIYTLASPYASTDLAELSCHNYRDYIRLTHPSFAPYELVRNSHASWTISLTTIGTSVAQPTGLTLTPIVVAAGSAIGMAVTAVDANGEESLPTKTEVCTNTNNYATASGGIYAAWSPVTNAQYYNVYRTVIVHLEQYYSPGQQLGFLGRAYSPRFTDNNIIPDFAITPPRGNNPFAGGVVEHINITNGGTGYNRFTTTVSLSGAGTGFVGQVLVDNATGEILGVLVLNGGSGYTGTTVSFSGGGGSGATATATTSPATGNYPRLATVFQQRQLYFATDNKPLTIFASKPKQFDNFDYGNVVVDNDSYEYDLDSDEIAPIKHVKNMRGGLLLMTGGGVWQFNGGANGQPVTATQALAEPQTYTGISDVPPLTVDTEVIYIEAKGFTVRMLAYNEFSKVYAGQDISVLSNHLFNSKNYITEWTFASDPFKLVWARRLDGIMLNLTILQEQKVFAWVRSVTKGQYQHVLAIEENNTDRVYQIVRRKLQGVWRQVIEYVADRRVDDVEDAFCVDCGLAYSPTYPDAELELDGITGTITVTASAAVFSAGDVGKILRVKGGKGTVTAYNSTTELEVLLVRDVDDTIPGTDEVLPAASGSWSLDSKFSTVSGLWHLEGETVQVLYDGNVQRDAVVANSGLTLPASASRVAIGLGYSCRAKSLPVTLTQETVENRRKRTVGVGVRYHQSRGLKVGSKETKVYEVKERTNEPYGEPTRLISGMKNVLVQSVYDEDGAMYFQVDDPLPVTILGYVQSAEVGDDPG